MDGVTVFWKKMLNGRHTPNGPTAADKRSVLAKLRRDTAGALPQQVMDALSIAEIS